MAGGSVPFFMRHEYMVAGSFARVSSCVLALQARADGTFKMDLEHKKHSTGAT